MSNPVVDKRQIGNLDPSEFPPQCQAGCATIINNVNACGGNLACACTTANGNIFRTCVDCVVAGNYTVQHELDGQAYFDLYYRTCTNAGHPVPHYTVSVSIAVSATATTTGGGGSGNQATTTAGGPATTTKPLGLTGVAVRNVGATRGSVMIVAVGIAVGLFLI